MYLGEKTIIIGDRRSFLDRLDGALAAENAVPIEINRRVVGIYQVITFEVHLKDGVIFLEEDAYLGKSITGPHHLVDRILRVVFPRTLQ